MTSLVGAILLRSWRSLKRETFLLILSNFTWVVASLPGWLLISYGAVGHDLILIIIALVALVPWALASFGLFSLVFQIGRARSVGFLDLFRQAWAQRRTASVWGAANLLVIAVLYSNARFYLSADSPLGSSIWGPIMSSFFLSGIAAWVMWQMLTLPLLVRGQGGGFLRAHRQSATILATRPLDVFINVLMILVAAFASAIVVPLGLLLGASLVAVIADQTVGVSLGETDPEALPKAEG